MDEKSLEIANAQYELTKKKKLYSSVNLGKLPDKGAKLKFQIEELENVLQSLSLETVTPDSSKSKDTACSTQLNALKLENEECSPKKNSVSDQTIREVTGKTKVVETSSCKTSLNNVNDLKESNSSLKLQESAKATSCNSSINQWSASQALSFSDLAKQAPKLSEKFANSPSFSGYRDRGRLPKICLTEAKPLHESQKPKNTYTQSFSSMYLLKTNEECVKKIHDSLVTCPEDSIEESDPETLKSELMMHQKKGLAWLLWREQQDPSGGILADDMGLGKTITIISLILKQKEKGNYFAFQEEKLECKGTLIICLASIIHQWNAEISKHTERDALNVLVYHGPKREKKAKELMKYDVVLTTYTILMTERKSLGDTNESPLFKLKWERIVLDEAHTIKNHKSQTAQAVFCLKGFRKWAVTGTPIHNNFKDMYSLLNFLQFSPFNDYKKFKKMVDDDSETSDQRRNLLVKSILLRRTKEETDNDGNPLIEMKNKTVRLCYIDLSDEEQKVYGKLNEKITKKVNQYLSKPSKLNANSSLLVLLLRLQQACNHVSLLKDEVEEDEIDVSFDITKTMSSLTIESDISNSSDSLNLTLDDIDINANNLDIKSSKIKKLFEKIKKISEVSENNEKSVIVSQWVSMLNIVAHHLELECIDYHVIVGSTKVEDRQKVVEDFNNNEKSSKILLLSLKAGGVGLNLVGANHLFLLDLHWNPALEMQACDRIHRVGQEKDVFIYKFICKNTIEEKNFIFSGKEKLYSKWCIPC